MAEKSEVNKSQSIRDDFATHKKATNQEVIDALGKQGCKAPVNRQNVQRAFCPQCGNPLVPGLIVRIHSTTPRRCFHCGVEVIPFYRRRPRPVARKVVATGGVGIPEVKAALAFIKATGSIVVAKQALAVAQEIRDIV